MKSSLIAILAATAASLASADIVMVQETTVGASPHKSKTIVSVQGDKVRTDTGTETSTIIDTASGMMTTLVHEQKMVMKINTKELSAAAAAPLPKGAEQNYDPKLTATGEKEKIQGYDCEIYTLEAMGVKTKMWVAKDYPGYEKYKAAMEKVANMASGPVKMPQIPGVAIQTQYENNGLKFTTTMVSIEDKKVDASIFEAPADYKAPGA